MSEDAISTIKEAELGAYKQFVELADKSVGRRGDLNKTFFTFHATLLSVQGFWGSSHDANVILITTLGLGLCLGWIAIVTYYGILIHQKAAVIREMEEQLSIPLWSRLLDRVHIVGAQKRVEIACCQCSDG